MGKIVRSLSGGRRSRVCRLETLEPRHLLAADVMAAISSAVGVQAVAVQTPSLRGSEVLPSSLESVARGSTYYVEVWIQDRLVPGVGLSGGTVDVNFATSVSQAVKVVNLDFQLFPVGTIDSANGVVRSLGGGVLQSGLGVAPDWVRLGYIETLATSSGEALFQLGTGASQFSRYGQGNVAWSLVDLGSPIVVTQVGGHWQNPIHPCDVNHDGTIVPLDALIAINDINLNGIRQLPVPGAGSQSPPPYYDVSGDDWLTAHDVLLVVNYLNANGAGPVPAGASSASPAAASGLAERSWAEGESLSDSLLAANSRQSGDASLQGDQTDPDASSQPETLARERLAVETNRSQPVRVSPSMTPPIAGPHRFERWELAEDLLTLLAERTTDRLLDDPLTL